MWICEKCEREFKPEARKIVAFTGPARKLSEAEREYVRRVVAELDAEVYVSGAARGVDTEAALAAIELHPAARHVLVRPARPHNVELTHAGFDEIVDMPEGTDYMDRNDELVARATTLVAFPETETERRRSGTWATVRRGRRADRKILLNPLNQA